MPPKPRTSLTDREKVFVMSYCAHYDMAKAARDAGYSPRRASAEARRLMDDPRVQAVVKRTLRNRFERYDITADRILEELAALAFTDATMTARTYTSCDGVQRVSAVDTDLLPAFVRKAITGLREGAHGQVEIKMADKIKALELLMRQREMLDGKDKSDGQVNVVVVPERATDEEGWQAKAADAYKASLQRVDDILGEDDGQ